MSKQVGARRRVGGIVAASIVLSAAGLILHEVWPKYGICLSTSRYDEIVCVARRNLHFSAHLTWSFNRRTVEAVMAEVNHDDIPVLAQMLGDERGVIRGLAGSVLPDLGTQGLAALRRAAESDDPTVRHAAESALMDHEIIKAEPEQESPQKRYAP